MFTYIVETRLRESKFKDHADDLMEEFKTQLAEIKCNDHYPVLTNCLSILDKYCDLIDRHSSIEMIRHIWFDEILSMLDHCMFCYDTIGNTEYNPNCSNITGVFGRLRTYTKRLNNFVTFREDHSKMERAVLRYKWDKRKAKVGRPKGRR